MKNSFFEKCKLLPSVILYLIHLWLSKSNVQCAECQTGISRKTIGEYFQYFRQVIHENATVEENIIGGENIVVELDESKIAKRKYNRGHHVEGVWLFGGIERTANKKTFFIPVQDRSANTLLPLIARHVRPGSIVHTDLWRSYARIEEELNMMHFTVNHSENFVDPTTGVHTNTIEGTWCGLKFSISPRNRTGQNIEKHIAEYQWRKMHKNDRWNEFLNLLRDTHFD